MQYDTPFVSSFSSAPNDSGQFDIEEGAYSPARLQRATDQARQQQNAPRPGEAENAAINAHLAAQDNARLAAFRQGHAEGTALLNQSRNALAGQAGGGPNAPMARGTLQDLNEIEPLVRRGVLGANDVSAVVRSNLMGDIAGNRDVRKATSDWQAIMSGSRNGTFNEQQTAGAVASFERTHGPAVASMVPEYQAYKGNLAPSTTPQDYLVLQNKLTAPVTGLTGQSLATARNDYIMAAHQLSQPGVTKQDVAAVQQNFAQLHPEFSKQVGLPLGMNKDQLVQAAGAAGLASAQEAAGDVPLTRDDRGNLRVNEGWKIAQQYKLEAQDVAHKHWIEQRREETDYLKSLDPGNKEPLDPDEAAQFRQHKAFYRTEAARIMSQRMANPQLPNPNGSSATAPPRDSSSVDASGAVATFTDPSKAEDSFRNGQLPAGRQFIMRGVRCVFDAQGKPSVVR
jgi:hypothetical protein